MPVEGIRVQFLIEGCSGLDFLEGYQPIPHLRALQNRRPGDMEGGAVGIDEAHDWTSSAAASFAVDARGSGIGGVAS